MGQISPWFERAFDFSFPVELFPNICARLRGTPARLEEALGDRDHEIFTAKPQGSWSAQEHAGHLLDLESLWLARVGDYAANRDGLTPADLQNRRTHEANYNLRPLAEILADFRTSRTVLLQSVEQYDAAVLTRTLPHPRLKTPMRLIDHLYFVAEHDDHHLARIWELINPI